MVNSNYRFGVEEELFLADVRTRGTPGRRAAAFHAAVSKRLERVEPELLQSQIEISSPPSASFAEAHAILSELRNDLADIGRQHGVLVFAAGTHPVARWSRQRSTQAERYQRIMQEVGMLGRRNVVCGMHVHVEVPRPERRIDLMNRLLPFLPLLLALSTSSPFWQGYPTGLRSYRYSVFGELPRTGIPDQFTDAADYSRYVRIMVQAGAIKDASFLWWAIRPSLRYPTLELRVADSCTKLNDTIAIAALYRCLVRMIDRRPDLNANMTGASRAIVAENLWRAQADGVQAELVDEQRERAIPFREHLDEVLALVGDDAAALACTPELNMTRRIAVEGSGADWQSRVYDTAAEHSSQREALSRVVDRLAEETGRSGKQAKSNPLLK